MLLTIFDFSECKLQQKCSTPLTLVNPLKGPDDVRARIKSGHTGTRRHAIIKS